MLLLILSLICMNNQTNSRNNHCHWWCPSRQLSLAKDIVSNEMIQWHLNDASVTEVKDDLNVFVTTEIATCQRKTISYLKIWLANGGGISHSFTWNNVIYNTLQRKQNVTKSDVQHWIKDDFSIFVYKNKTHISWYTVVWCSPNHCERI